ncbi:MAG TPA: hypothetical protein VE090_02085 [Methylomirabilota bacterium]|nr:hypothetical protein [Methylomirabilota bacterium]
MDIKYQDLEATKGKVIKMYSKNPRRSIAATFRVLRLQQSISYVGDFPILSVIVKTIIDLDILPTRFQVTYALSQLEEMEFNSKKGKIELLNDLLEPLYVQTKQAKNSLGKTKKQKMTHASSE